MKRFGRESDRYIGSLNQKQFAQELKAVYQAFYNIFSMKL